MTKRQAIAVSLANTAIRNSPSIWASLSAQSRRNAISLSLVSSRLPRARVLALVRTSVDVPMYSTA